MAAYQTEPVVEKTGRILYSTGYPYFLVLEAYEYAI
jgi:hypothetical protein